MMNVKKIIALMIWANVGFLRNLALHEFSLIFLFAWISIDWRIKNLSCVSPKENVLPKFDGYFLCGTIADNNLIQQGLNIV